MIAIAYLTALLLMALPDISIQTSAQTSFIHPGTVIAPENIARMPSITQSSDPVVVKGLKELLEFADNSLHHESRAKAKVHLLINPAAHDKEHGNEVRAAYQENIRRAKESGATFACGEQFNRDAKRMVFHTYAFLITKNNEHAKKAIDLLNSWSVTVKEFGPKNQNGPLVAAWGLVSMARTAEILKHTFPGWAESPVEKNFISFVETQLMPSLTYYEKDGKINNFVAQGNWGSSIVEARLQYAIFRESQEEYAWAKENHKMMFDNMFPFNNGREIETTRDIMHAQFGLGGLTGAAELFKHQGVDVYSMRDFLLQKSYEYHAGILLGERPAEIPEFRIVQFVAANWDIAFAYYHTQLGLEMPKTVKLMQKERPEGFELGWGLGTISHYPFAQKGEVSPVSHQVPIQVIPASSFSHSFEEPPSNNAPVPVTEPMAQPIALPAPASDQQSTGPDPKLSTYSKQPILPFFVASHSPENSLEGLEAVKSQRVPLNHRKKCHKTSV